MEPVARLSLPMAVAAAGGAAVVSSMTRWWLLGPYHGLVAMIVAAASGAWIGAMLTYSLRADPLGITLRKCTIGTLVLGPVCALLTSLVCDPRERGAYAVLLGLSFAIAVLPCVLVAVLLARHAMRSRVRSLVGASDRRAAWRAAAGWLGFTAAIGTVPNHIDGTGEGFWAETFWWGAHEKAVLSNASLLVAVSALFIAATVAALDLRAQWVVRRTHRASSDWRVDDNISETTALDVGVGHAAWIERVHGRDTYREHAVERIAAFGDLDQGRSLLRAATFRSLATLAIVIATHVITHVGATRVR